jgi:hypothetical protein
MIENKGVWPGPLDSTKRLYPSTFNNELLDVKALNPGAVNSLS